MKKFLRPLLLIAVLTGLLCVSVSAAGPIKGGMYDVDGNGVTITPQTSDRTEIEPAVEGGYGNDYAGAERFNVTISGLASGNQYLLLVLKGTNVIPKEENIVYIDQAAADKNGTATFDAYPSSLTTADYSVYLVGVDKTFAADDPDATFSYNRAYKLGDVDKSGSISVNDALFVLQAVAHSRTLDEDATLAADVDRSGSISVNDALFILQAVAHSRTLE